MWDKLWLCLEEYTFIQSTKRKECLELNGGFFQARLLLHSVNVSNDKKMFRIQAPKVIFANQAVTYS